MVSPRGLVDTARRLSGRGGDLDARLAGLAQAVEVTRGRLDDERVAAADAAVTRARGRLRLSAEHTVVALAGATGSGKSSTFNALTGLDLARVGVRRPTTAWTTACVWGDDPATELLEWLGIPDRHRALRESLLEPDRPDREREALSGLVLLDLPDHDSTEVAHHLEVERLVGLADLLVWVLDPQKYADAAVHERFLRPLAGHGDTMLVLLNHVDEVPPARRPEMLDDVARLLRDDGLTGVPVLGTSARDGDGLPELRAVLAARVAAKASARDRASTAVAEAAASLSEANGDAAPHRLSSRDQAELRDAMADAAGVPVVTEAVRLSTAARARRATGWPLTSWIGRLKPDPLRRLHLRPGGSGRRPAPDESAPVARTSVPEASLVQRARVDAAVRGVGDRVSADLTRPWADAVRRAAVSRTDDVRDALDRAVAGTDLGAGGLPLWTRGVRALQWLLLLVALAGGVWLGVLAVLGYLRLDDPATPDYGGLPVPTLMLVLGVLLGVVLALLSRALVAASARGRARRADRRLRAAVETVVAELVVAPLETELATYDRARDALRRARG